MARTCRFCYTQTFGDPTLQISCDISTNTQPSLCSQERAQYRAALCSAGLDVRCGGRGPEYTAGEPGLLWAAPAMAQEEAPQHQRQKQPQHEVCYSKTGKSFCNSSHEQHCTLAVLHDPGGQQRCLSTWRCFGVNQAALPRAKRTAAYPTPWLQAMDPILPASPTPRVLQPPE